MAGALTDSLVDGMAGVRTLAAMISIQPETGRMNKMKMVLASMCLAAIPALSAAPSLARDYPFCRKGEAGPGDCRYETLEQCQAAVSGTAGASRTTGGRLPDVTPRLRARAAPWDSASVFRRLDGCFARAQASRSGMMHSYTLQHGSG